MTRWITALLVLAAAIAAIFWSRRTETTSVRLVWVATARQMGPVSYRDPAGAISPDGSLVAYSEGRFLRVRPIDGGPVVDLPAGEAQIRNLAWFPDSRRILTDGFQTQSGWAIYDHVARTRQAASIGDVRQPSISPDGKKIAAVGVGREGPELKVLSIDGAVLDTRTASGRISYPAWTPSGDISCIATADGRSRLTIPCGGQAIRTNPDLDVYGPVAFAPDGRTAYLAMPNGGGTLDLWAAPLRGGGARRLTMFSRDTYAPTVANDGTVFFKVQSYRTVVSVAPAAGGPVQALAVLQSETPSWDPTGRFVGITYGSWRRVVDDAKYPDIAQDAGIIPADGGPAHSPSSVVHASPSEDQSLCWSPNGRWLAFHSHKDQSDDIWLRPANGDASPTRISFLGRGAESGWPRWSSDGQWLIFTGASRTTHRTAIYVIGMDQEKGSVRAEAKEVAVSGFDGNISHAEWLPGSDRLVAIGKEGAGRYIIFTVARDGGEARPFHRFASEHDAPGLGVSPDGREVAFVAPAGDGYFQLFRKPIASGDPVQVTNDPSNKTQPAWSPDGRRIAFTVWSYDAQFFRSQR